MFFRGLARPAHFAPRGVRRHAPTLARLRDPRPAFAMGYAGYAPGHKVVELTVLQQLLKLIKSDKSLETLEKLTRNSAQAPAEEKFRKVRRGSATVSTRVCPLVSREPPAPDRRASPRSRAPPEISARKKRKNDDCRFPPGCLERGRSTRRPVFSFARESCASH